MSRCPGCGFDADAAINVQLGNNDAPRPGDLALCTRCETYLQFDERLNLVHLKADVMRSLSELEWMTLDCARKEARMRATSGECRVCN
jgi:hypothetical protein